MATITQDTKNNLIRLNDLSCRLQRKINFLLSESVAWSLESNELVEMYTNDVIGLAKQIGKIVEAD